MLKITEPIKKIFSLQNGSVYLANILNEPVMEPWFRELSTCKEFFAELGQSDQLPLYKSNFANIQRNTEKIFCQI